jgi:hypothetical protein
MAKKKVIKKNIKDKFDAAYEKMQGQRMKDRASKGKCSCGKSKCDCGCGR